MSRRAAVAIGLLAMVGCGDAVDGVAPTAAGVPDTLTPSTTQAQEEAFARLQSSTEHAFTWSRHARLHRQIHLSGSRKGRAILRDPALADAATLSFLAEHRALFEMRAPSEELRLVRRDRDDLGMTHVRFQQTLGGVPVTGGEVAAHYDASGHLTSIDSNYRAISAIDVTPAVKPPAADSVLEVFAPAGARPRLVWTTTVDETWGPTPAIWATKIDAKTGELVERTNQLHFDKASAAGLLGDTKTFEATRQTTGYVLAGTVEGTLVRTYTAENGTTLPGTAVVSRSLTTWDPAAVDAQAHAEGVVKYYKERHDRDSIDGLGGDIVSTVHYGVNLDNAFWNGKQMIYGDGDGVNTRGYSAASDIVGHELTHGVIERTAQLGIENEPGALNEAAADIMGAFFAHYEKPDPLRNWIHGHGKMIAPIIQFPSRYLIDPSLVGDPCHMSEKMIATEEQKQAGTDDHGHIHSNSNIISHTAYLMTVGGTNAKSNVEVKYGIGYEKAERVWYRAITKYWLSTTSFAEAAEDLVAAAKDLELTANEQNIIDCAFKATGVLSGACEELLPTTASEAPPNDDDANENEAKDDDKAAPSTRKTSSATATTGCSAGAGSRSGHSLATPLLLTLALAVLRRRRPVRA